MTREQHILCEKIIQKASMAAGTMSLASSPSMPGTGMEVMPVQISMAIALGNVFGLTLTHSAAQGLCSSMMELAIEFPSFPGKHSTWNTIRNAVRLTETLGWKLAEKFEKECKNR